MTDAAAAVERYVDAYNAQDWAVLEEVFAPDLHFEHVGRGFAFDTSAELIATLKVFASEYLPDRAFSAAIRRNAAGNTVYREHMWTGTLATDLEGFGKKGDSVDSRLCAVFTVNAEGRIVEYLDYG
jgi:steroid delta-isomerase-like uncharacterized protein